MYSKTRFESVQSKKKVHLHLEIAKLHSHRKHICLLSIHNQRLLNSLHKIYSYCFQLLDLFTKFEISIKNFLKFFFLD